MALLLWHAFYVIFTLTLITSFYPNVSSHSVFDGANNAIVKAVYGRQKLDRYKHKSEHMPGVTVVNGFSWSDCGGKGSKVKFNQLSLSPDPFKIPGNVTVSFDVTTSTDIQAPLEVALTIKKKILFWIEIPCVDDVGSCTYDDVCSLIASSKCPPIFKKYGIPCQCPVKAGHYALPKSNIDVKLSVDIPKWLSEGDYEVTAKIRETSSQVGCLSLHLSFKD